MTLLLAHAVVIGSLVLVAAGFGVVGWQFGCAVGWW